MKNNKIRPFVLAENNWKSVKNETYTVAVLPWGATEAHNYHLPYATDNIIAEYVAISAAEKAWNQDAKVVVLPTVPFGVNTGQMDVSLCLNMMPSTQLTLLKDLVQVLSVQKIDKLVILNAHGGNHFKQIIRELSLIYPDVFICAINWWQVAHGEDYFDEPGDHAGELETSALMHISPNLVLSLDQAGNGSAKTFKIKGLKYGWASAQRKWTDVTQDTGVGDPKMSTDKKGEIYLKLAIDKIAEFFKELHQADTNDLYE